MNTRKSHTRALGAAVAVALCILPSWGARGAEFIPLRAAVHVDTSVSHSYRTLSFAGIPIRTWEGKLPRTVEKVANLAREQNIDVLILADRARADVSYALTPFSRLFKVTFSEGSIASYGAARYLERVSRAEQVSGVMIIPGAECIPYYRWHGNPLTGLRLSHLYEHMVIAGLDTPELIEGIPDTASGYGFRFSWTVAFNAVFVALFLVGRRLWRRRPNPRKVTGGLLMAVALLALIDCAPFLPRNISAYDTPAINPSDELAAYARDHQALAFWAHPSANPGSLPHRLRKTSGIDIDVKPYRDVLHTTKDYTGFAMFNAGILAGKPGQEWDTALEQYCKGERRRPVWAVSECDFDAHSPPDGLSDAIAVIWARERSKGAVLDALRNGRCYATLMGVAKGLRIESYGLSDGARTVGSGDRLRTSAASVKLTVRLVSVAPEYSMRCQSAQVIVDGRERTVPLKQAPDGAALEATADIEVPRAGKVSYVRVLVCENRQPILALNPIFVSRDRAVRGDRK